MMDYSLDDYNDYCKENAEPIYELGQRVGYVYPNGAISYEVEDNFTEEKSQKHLQSY